MSEASEVSHEDCSQPWQLLALQEAADYGNEKEHGAQHHAGVEHHACVTELLSGMLHVDVAQRLTAKQLASQQWLKNFGVGKLDPCPTILQKVLQK